MDHVKSMKSKATRKSSQELRHASAFQLGQQLFFTSAAAAAAAAAPTAAEASDPAETAQTHSAFPAMSRHVGLL